MRRCDVQGLLLGGCGEYATSGMVLCTYHQKLWDMLLLPPGDDGFFTKDDRESEPLPAVMAYISYRASSYPEFAHLVPTDTVPTEVMDVVPVSQWQDRVPA